MGHLVFIYGTLKRGERNHARMAGARFVGPAVTRDSAFTLAEHASVSMPGCTTPSVSTGGAHRIAGEVYAVEDALLAALDLFERVGTDYRRQTVQLAQGGAAQMYLRPADGVRPVLAGRPRASFDGNVASWSEVARP